MITVIIDSRSENKCELICFEVDSRGTMTKENKDNFRKIAKVVDDRQARDLRNQASRLVLIGSFVIYKARVDPL